MVKVMMVAHDELRERAEWPLPLMRFRWSLERRTSGVLAQKTHNPRT
jgi:hypothetical protein